MWIINNILYIYQIHLVWKFALIMLFIFTKFQGNQVWIDCLAIVL